MVFIVYDVFEASFRKDCLKIELFIHKTDRLTWYLLLMIISPNGSLISLIFGYKYTIYYDIYIPIYYDIYIPIYYDIYIPIYYDIYIPIYYDIYIPIY
jgi:hypothetical protein